MHPQRQAYVEEEEAEDEGVTYAQLPIETNYNLASGEKASAVYGQFERNRLAQSIAVPTDDLRVRDRLRALGEPITLFGEDKAARRARLRELLTQRAEAGVDEDESMVDAGEEEEGDAEEEFFTEGTQALLEARIDMAQYSLPRAKERLAYQVKESAIPLKPHVENRKAIKGRLSGFNLQASQNVGERPVSIARFSPNGEIIAAGNWAGQVQLMSVPDLNITKTLRGHRRHLGGIAWHPRATLPSSDISSSAVNLATSGGEGKIYLYNLEKDTPISTLNGHTSRVCRIEFHPSGKYLASASYDTSWRLWDVNTAQELQLQEGHASQVYTVAFQSDGSLLASAGLDSVGRIWDLRTGKTVMLMDGHIQPIYGLDWGADGYRIVSGSGDGFVKCWDLRAMKDTSSILAHKGGVTDLRWFKGLDGPHPIPFPTTRDTKDSTMGGTAEAAADVTANAPTNGDEGDARSHPLQNGENDENGENGEHGEEEEYYEFPPKKAGTFCVSSGFDKELHVWSADDWALTRKLGGHTGNILSCDVSGDSRWILSTGQDRTVKLWGRDDGLGIA